MVQGLNLHSGINVFLWGFLFDSWMVLLHNRLHENRIAPPITGSCELFLATSHRDSRIHAGEMEDWSCLYTITEEEEKSLNHCWKIGGFCAVWEALEYGPWKSIFFTVVIWSQLSTEQQLQALCQAQVDVQAPICVFYHLTFPITLQHKAFVWLALKFSAATVGMSLCSWRC